MDTLAFDLIASPFLASGAGSATPIIGLIAALWLISAGTLAWKRSVGLAVAAGFGLAVSLYLGFQHAVDAGTSICSVSEIFNCDTVNRSVYSEIAGVPIAFLGAGFYAAVVVVSLLSDRKPEQYSRASALVLVGSLASVAYSGFLAWASVQLGAWCLFCISLYGLNLILLVGSALAARAAGPVGEGVVAGITGRDDSSVRTMALTFVVAVAVSLFAYSQMTGGESTTPDLTNATPDEIDPASLAVLFEATASPLVLDGTEPVLGDPSAPYVVIEFADYECPHCAQTAPTIKELVAKYPQIQVLFKHYPISGLCNKAVGAEGHKNACAAAAAAECARQQGHFWELSDLMFKNQDYLSKDDIRFMATQVNLDAAAFEQCMGDPATEVAVRVDAGAGEDAGLRGTPSLYLQGVKPGEIVHVKGLAEEAAALVTAHQMGIVLPPTPPFSGQ
jgi:protein-disulfide isomerase